MRNELKNGKTFPRRYYGLHMAPGVAEYREENSKPYRIFINESTIKKMDPTFEGRPVYVHHVADVDPEKLGKADPDSPSGEMEEVGYVVKSFFNSVDGQHWVEFLVISDRGHDAIKKGWQLSNAYHMKGAVGPSGQWHGVDYQKEVLDGEYEHLAIVPNPRYEESVIMTPEEFKAYNESKKTELTKLANSKEKETSAMKLNFFKREKVENAVDLEKYLVVLPKTGKEIAIADLVTEMDKVINMQGYANGDHMVKVGEHEMSVNDLVKKHMDMCNEMEEMKKPKNEEEEEAELKTKEEKVDVEGDLHNDEDEEAKKKAEELAAHEEKEIKEKKDKKENAADKAKKEENFKKLKNAPYSASQADLVYEMGTDQVARGKARYGTQKSI